MGSVIGYSDTDSNMHSAIVEAKQSIAVFFDNLSNPKPNQEGFLLKVAFELDESTEHMWVADLDLSVLPFKGTIAVEPTTPEFAFMERVNFAPAQITDWMFIEDGYLVGGYTTNLIRSEMSPADRLVHDRNAPYKFRD